MSICEDLQKKLSENGSYAETLREKILYCIGYLESDDCNDDLYNLLTYMLYSEKVYPDEIKTSKDRASIFPFFPRNDFYRGTLAVPMCNDYFDFCKSCKHYLEDVHNHCTTCYHFSGNSSDHSNYMESDNATKS